MPSNMNLTLIENLIIYLRIPESATTENEFRIAIHTVSSYKIGLLIDIINRSIRRHNIKMCICGMILSMNKHKYSS